TAALAADVARRRRRSDRAAAEPRPDRGVVAIRKAGQNGHRRAQFDAARILHGPEGRSGEMGVPPDRAVSRTYSEELQHQRKSEGESAHRNFHGRDGLPADRLQASGNVRRTGGARAWYRADPALERHAAPRSLVA